MARKTAKGLWISVDLAEEFDREVERLAQLMPERLEAGEVGAAALLSFLRLPSDKQKLEAIRAARTYALDRAIRSLKPGSDGDGTDVRASGSDTLSSSSSRRSAKGARRKRKTDT